MRPLGATDGAAGRRAHRRGDQPRPRRRGARGPLPRRSLLPAARGGARAAAAARAARGRARARESLPRARRARARSVTGLEPEALERLIAHRWDGQRARAREHDRGGDRARAGPARDGRGPAPGRASSAPRAAVPEDIDLSLEAFERACLEEALRRCQGDVRARREAARHRPQHVLPQAPQVRLIDYARLRLAARAAFGALARLGSRRLSPRLASNAASSPAAGRRSRSRRRARGSARRARRRRAAARSAHASGRRASRRAQRRTPQSSEMPRELDRSRRGGRSARAAAAGRSA